MIVGYCRVRPCQSTPIGGLSPGSEDSEAVSTFLAAGNHMIMFC